MKALCWHGKGDMRCETVPDPIIQHPRDAIIKVTACAICGSDLHIFDGVILTMEKGDVLGHETMGEVVEVGAENEKLKVGDRVVVPFTIACGECFFCKRGYYSGCERSNPNARRPRQLWGHSPAALFGYSHLLGGVPGRPGGIPARSLCRRRPDQGPRRSARTSRCCSYPTSFRPATWRRSSATSNQATPSRFGAAARSASSRSAAPCSLAPNASSLSKPFLNALRLAEAAGAEIVDFTKEDVYARIPRLGKRRETILLSSLGIWMNGDGDVYAKVPHKIGEPIFEPKLRAASAAGRVSPPPLVSDPRCRRAAPCGSSGSTF